MLRLDYFLMRSGLLVENDELVHNAVGSFKVLLCTVKNFNEKVNEADRYTIGSFTPRTNNGKQPMPSDFPVVIYDEDGDIYKGSASEFEWSHDNFKSWKPDLEKLLEQQNEYDKKEGVMISEREMMIVDAVNKLEGDTANFMNGFSVNQDTVASNRLGYIFGSKGFLGIAGWSLVCSIKEIDRCIHEMSEGSFVPNAKPEFVYGQDVYVEDAHFANKTVKFGCLSLDGNSAILLTEGGYMSYPLSGVSSKPFKTKEETELEKAELAQLNRILEKHSGKFMHPNQFKRAISEMQKDGELAELLLPLESK